MSDLEDGEVLGSDEEEEEVSTPRVPRAPANSLEFPVPPQEFPDEFDYVIPDRPKSSLPRTTAAAASSSVVVSAPAPPPVVMPGASAGVFGNVDNMTAFGQPQSPADPTLQLSSSFGISPSGDHDMYDGSRKAYYRDLGVSDLLVGSQSSGEDSSNSDSDDSDYGNQYGKKTRKRFAPAAPPINNNAAPSGDYAALFSNPNASSSVPSGSANAASSSSNLSAFQAFASNFQKQRKPNNIWANVMQEEQISDVFGGVKVEERSLTNIEVERGPETYSYYRPMRPPRQRRASDSSDISSEGLSDNALHYLRGGASFNEEEEEIGDPSGNALPKSFTCKNAFRKTASSKRRRTQPKLKRKVFNKLKKMKAPDLAQYMATKLYEDKVKLLERAIEILGKDKCIQLFIKTLKIEKRGGLMVKSHDRRRTPGGVFLYLVRGDRRIRKNQVDAIFKDERAFHDKYRKKMAAVGRLSKKAKLEAQKEKIELGAGADTTMRDDSYSNDAAPWQEQDGTDPGQLGDNSAQEESSVHEKDATTEECSSYSEMQCDG